MPQKISPGRNGRGKLGKWIVAAPSPGGKAEIGGCDRIVRKSPPLPAKQHPKVNTASRLPLCARSSLVQELRARDPAAHNFCFSSPPLSLYSVTPMMDWLLLFDYGEDQMMVMRSPSVRGPRHFARSVSLQRRNLPTLGLITGIAALGMLAAGLWVRMVLF